LNVYFLQGSVATDLRGGVSSNSSFFLFFFFWT